MKAQISYTLSEAGQRAEIARLGTAVPREQKIEVDVSNGYLPLFAVNSDGSLQSRNIMHNEGWSWSDKPTFDHILSGAEALDALAALNVRVAARRAADAEEKAQKEDAARKKNEQRDYECFQALQSAVADPAARWAIDSIYGIGGPRSALAADKVSSWWKVPDALKTECEPLIAEMQRRNQHDKEISERIKNLPPEAVFHNILSAPDKDSGWAKILTSVSPTAKDGYGYDGAWGTGSGVCGDVVIIVDKWWEGSRKRGHMESSATIKVRGPQWWYTAADTKGQLDEGDGWAIALRQRAIDFLALDPAERVRQSIEARIALNVANLDRCVADPADSADVVAKIAERKAAIEAGIARMREELDSLTAEADAAIVDIDSAALAIVTAGYRALAKDHHPDAGGSEATMSLLNQAKSQLKEMLKLAGQAVRP